MEHIRSLLEHLAQQQDQLVALHAQHQAVRASHIPPRVRVALEHIDSAYYGQMEALSRTMAALEAQVKEAVLRHGSSVKGSVLHAVYVSGRVTWNDAYLQGYAATHPDILPARREGPPGVSLRKSVT